MLLHLLYESVKWAWVSAKWILDLCIWYVVWNYLIWTCFTLIKQTQKKGNTLMENLTKRGFIRGSETRWWEKVNKPLPFHAWTLYMFKTLCILRQTFIFSNLHATLQLCALAQCVNTQASSHHTVHCMFVSDSAVGLIQLRGSKNVSLIVWQQQVWLSTFRF